MGVETVSTLLARGADEQGDRAALLAPGRSPLSYSELAEEVEALAGQLRRRGVGPRDRIALVAPDGPELAIAFLAATSIGALGRPVEVVVVPGSHESLLHGDGQGALARELRRRLRNCAGQ